MKKFIAFCVLSSFGILCDAQEFKFNVFIDSEQIKNSASGSYTDKAYFIDMQQQFSLFLNNTKWSKLTLKPEERISCNLYITIREVPAINQFKGTAQFQSSRPIYGSS